MFEFLCLFLQIVFLFRVPGYLAVLSSEVCIFFSTLFEDDLPDYSKSSSALALINSRSDPFVTLQKAMSKF